MTAYNCNEYIIQGKCQPNHFISYLIQSYLSVRYTVMQTQLSLFEMPYCVKWQLDCNKNVEVSSYNPHDEGILPKGPYPPCLSMADRTLLAGYPRWIMVVIYYPYHNPSQSLLSSGPWCLCNGAKQYELDMVIVDCVLPWTSKQMLFLAVKFPYKRPRIIFTESVLSLSICGASCSGKCPAALHLLSIPE